MERAISSGKTRDAGSGKRQSALKGSRLVMQSILAQGTSPIFRELCPILDSLFLAFADKTCEPLSNSDDFVAFPDSGEMLFTV